MPCCMQSNTGNAFVLYILLYANHQQQMYRQSFFSSGIVQVLEGVFYV